MRSALYKYWPLLSFPVLVILVYHQAYWAEYLLWDDDALIQNNSMLQKPFYEAFKTAFTIFYHGDYFPFTLLSYWVDHYFFGQSSRAMHIVNLILQCLNVVLLYLFLKQMKIRQEIALLTTLVFAIHPLQTETVMWISERKSLVSAFFTFLSLNLYILSQSEQKKRFYILAVLCFIGASLAKATSILLPVLFIFLDWFEFKDKRKVLLRTLAPALGALVLMVLRYQAYAVSVSQVTDTMWHPERLKHVPLMALNAIGFYFQKFFVPTDFSAVYPNYFPTQRVILTSIFVGVILLMVLFFTWKQKNKVALFFWGWFLLFLLPVLQIVPRINYVNDRYMYLPIIGFVVGLMALLPNTIWLKTKGRAALILFLVLIPTLGVTSYGWSQVWVNNRALWSNAISVMPESVIARNNLALDYQAKAEYEKAIEQYTLIINYASEIQNKLLAYNNMANIYANPTYSGHSMEKAIQLLQDGISQVQQKRDSYELRVNLALIYRRLQRYQLARQIFIEILQDLHKEPDFRFQWLKPVIQQSLNDMPYPGVNP